MGRPHGSEANTVTETIPQVDQEVSTRTQLDGGWQVIVWDDPINLMSYVVYVFQKLFGFSLQKATLKMREVHEQGRSIVATADREDAEQYVSSLHLYGLQATMERVLL